MRGRDPSCFHPTLNAVLALPSVGCSSRELFEVRYSIQSSHHSRFTRVLIGGQQESCFTTYNIFAHPKVSVKSSHVPFRCSRSSTGACKLLRQPRYLSLEGTPSMVLLKKSNGALHLGSSISCSSSMVPHDLPALLNPHKTVYRSMRYPNCFEVGNQD